ncbi:MAG TPA: hypothetical protein VFP65_26255 [Anaeromyxobacteraceae bacterium]|nr:hypothetical protein [Anaeromyxobacteraceae bacterium]
MSPRDDIDPKRRAYAAALAELRSTPTRYAWSKALRMRRELLGIAREVHAPAPVAPFPLD